MFFYAVFAIALFAKQRFAVVAGASVFLVAFSVLLGPRGVVFLGDISYALYCTHLLSFSFVAWIVAKLAISPVGHAWAYFGAMLATGLVIAVGTYLMFEKPTTDFLKRLIERPRLPVNYSAVPQSPGKGGSL
jgi:peptidoglycan/LPS O-acetylase OafA/YrhL